MLGVVALLVFGVTRLFGGSAPAPRPTAAPVAAPSSGLTRSATVTPTVPQNVDRARPHKRKHHRHTKKPVTVPLALPTGPCPTGDVSVSPSVRRAYAGQQVTITLDLTTQSSPACTWEVSPDTVVVELTSGSDRIWSSQDCPTAIGQHSVIVREDHVTKVPIVWAARRSDSGCPQSTLWAQPGWYHVKAAAFGGGPTDEQFRLLAPPRPTVTKTPKPHKHSKASPTKASSTNAATPTPTPSSSATP